MKKINLFFAFALTIALSTTAFAMDFNGVNSEINQPVQERVEIAVSDLPAPITSLLGDKFAGYSVDKAYKVEKQGTTVYFVDLSKDGQSVTMLFDENGNVIEG